MQIKLLNRVRHSYDTCRYNDSDQPVCRICDVVVKSESLWDMHQLSRKHREVIYHFCSHNIKHLIGLKKHVVTLKCKVDMKNEFSLLDDMKL